MKTLLSITANTLLVMLSVSAVAETGSVFQCLEIATHMAREANRNKARLDCINGNLGSIDPVSCRNIGNGITDDNIRDEARLACINKVANKPDIELCR